MECEIDYSLLDRQGIISLIKDDCVDCNLKVRMMKGIRCPDCPFVSCSGQRKSRKNYFTTGIACGVKFRQYGIDPNGRLGKSYLFYFLYNQELNFKLPDFPEHDSFGNLTTESSQWIMHHKNRENWNDHIWNIELCLRSEHPSIEKADEAERKLLSELSYDLLKYGGCP